MCMAVCRGEPSEADSSCMSGINGYTGVKGQGTPKCRVASRKAWYAALVATPEE